MDYTVKQLSDRAGVSVRTLHYYDEIGLLRPTRVGLNGYRYYGEAAVLRLQQILFYRELDFSLDDIAAVLDEPGFNVVQALETHRGALEQRLGRLARLVQTVDQTIAHLKSQRALAAKDLFAGFTEEQEAAREREAEARWGAEARESARRWKAYSPTRRQEIMAEAGAVYQDFVTRIGEAADSAAVQAIVARWHQNLRYFYEPTFEILRGLAEGYCEDPAFRTFFDRLDRRLAPFIREAVKVYCGRATGIAPSNSGNIRL
jgi:DNA-binding transcriptional MerR regulator